MADFWQIRNSLPVYNFFHGYLYLVPNGRDKAERVGDDYLEDLWDFVFHFIRIDGSFKLLSDDLDEKLEETPIHQRKPRHIQK